MSLFDVFFWERRNEIRDSDEKSAGCGILVKKELECGIRTPPSRPCKMASGSVSAIKTPSNRLQAG